MNLKTLIPWHAKIAAKLVLSRIPAAYAFWHRFDLFSHGLMDRPDYAIGVFSSHYDRTDFERKGHGFVAMEFGPGDSALSAVIAQAYGATSCYLVDAGGYATHDVGLYRHTATLLSDRALARSNLADATTFDEVLQRCHAQYLTEGLASLRTLPSQSVDFMWSQAVLEHVRRDDFLPVMKELRRILRPNGACSHTVDLKDHLGGGLNNMRISSRWWEREWMANSGFYTNRLRLSEMLDLFQQAGFKADLIGVDKWDRLPVRNSALAREFRHLTDSDLLVKEFDVLLRAA